VPHEEEISIALVDGPESLAAESEIVVGYIGVRGVETLVEVELLGLDSLRPILHDVGPSIVGVEVGGPLLHILVLLAYRLLLQVVGLAATTMGSKQSEIRSVMLLSEG